MKMDRASTLEARIRRLEDRQELSDLVGRYETALDDFDIDALVECFTSDGAFHVAAGAGADLGDDPDARGRENLRAHYLKRMTNHGPTLHYHHSQFAEFQSEDSATGVVMSHAELCSNGHAVIMALRYYDKYRREDGRWRFEDRATRVWYDMKMSELPERLCDPLRLRRHDSPKPAQLPESLETYRRIHGLV
jgi:hypothetical protein